jgi:eukaryotic-like serine/threonine-protein kinase
LNRTCRDDGTQFWLIDVARGTTTRADVGRNPVWAPVLSQDGQSLTYISREEGRSAVVERPAHGGTGRVVFEYRGEGVLYLSDRTWDGQAVLVGVGERNGRHMQLVPVTGGQPRVIRDGPVSQMTARISPDGKWLAFASGEAEQMQVSVSPIPATGQQWQISAAGGEYPQWRGDGRELFFIAPDGSVMSASIAAGPGFDFTPPRVLFRTGLVAGEFSQRFVATADGKQFLFNMLREGDSAATITALRVILNWPDGSTQ